MIGKKNSVYCELFRKYFQAVIQHPGKARDEATSVIGETVKDTGGVCFFRHFEQIMQLVSHGLDKVVEDIVLPSFNHGWSKESSKKLLERFHGEENIAHLGMAMLEGAAISDFCKPLCIACYSLEGDSPLILSAYEVLKNLDDVVDNIDTFSLPRVHEVVGKFLV